MSNFKENHSKLLLMAKKVNSEILSMKYWFDEIPHLVAIGDGFKFLKVNKMFEKVLGWAPDEIIKMQWISLVHPDDIEITINLFSSEDVPLTNFFNRYRTKEGQYIWIQWMLSPIKNGQIYISGLPHYENSPLLKFIKTIELERLSSENNDTELFV